MIAFAWVLAWMAGLLIVAAALRFAAEVLLELARRHDIGRHLLYAAAFAWTWPAVLLAEHRHRNVPGQPG